MGSESFKLRILFKLWSRKDLASSGNENVTIARDKTYRQKRLGTHAGLASPARNSCYSLGGSRGLPLDQPLSYHQNYLLKFYNVNTLPQSHNVTQPSNSIMKYGFPHADENSR